jgi:3-hydroxyisobutyrate dehydrogenase-like beta-hydroxyacid dehydrogenase
MLDAPVSGEWRARRDGTLTIMVGGDAVIERQAGPTDPYGQVSRRSAAGSGYAEGAQQSVSAAGCSPPRRC